MYLCSFLVKQDFGFTYIPIPRNYFQDSYRHILKSHSRKIVLLRFRQLFQKQSPYSDSFRRFRADFFQKVPVAFGLLPSDI